MVATMVDEVCQFYRQSGFATVADYLKFYLCKDVQILQLAIVQLSRSFFHQLGINFLGLQKNTISSLANAAAHAYLLREKRHGVMTCNHTKIYSILKQGLRGGKHLVGSVLGLLLRAELKGAAKAAAAAATANLHIFFARVRAPQVTPPCIAQWRATKRT